MDTRQKKYKLDPFEDEGKKAGKVKKTILERGHGNPTESYLMNDPLPQTDTQACAVRSLFQIAFLTESHVCNVSYRCSCNYDYSSQYR